MAVGNLLLLLLRSLSRVVDHPSPTHSTSSSSSLFLFLCFHVFTLTLLCSAADVTYSTSSLPSSILPGSVIIATSSQAQPASHPSKSLSFPSSSVVAEDGNTNHQILSSLVDFLWASNHSGPAPSGGTFEDDLAEFVSMYQQEEHDSSSSSIRTTPPSVSTSVSSSTRIFTRSSSTSSSNLRKRERQQTGFQDIISGLVKLLGGKNVHVANQSGDLAPGSLDAPRVVPPARLNHRAPPKLTFFTNTAGITTSSLVVPSTTTSVTENVQLTTSFTETLTRTQSRKESTTVPLPTGPITEWVPVYQQSSTTSLEDRISASSTTEVLTETQKWSSSTEPTKIWTSSPTSHPTLTSSTQTEVGYAAKPLPESTTRRLPTLTSSRTNLRQSTTKSTPYLPRITTTTAKSNQQTSTKTVQTMPLPTLNSSPTLNIRPTTVSKSSSTAGVGPTGSPFVIPVDIEQIRLMGGSEPEESDGGSQQSDQSVYIDGRKTYFDLNPNPTQAQTSATGRPGGDTTLVNVGVGYSFPVAANENDNLNKDSGNANRPVHPGSVSSIRLKQPNWPPPQRPLQSPPKTVANGRPMLINKHQVRIDTCIIGDESACNGELNETCRVETGVSSCYCRLGFGRIETQLQNTGCQPVVSLVVYIRVDRVNNEALVFGPEYQNPTSDKYHILESEAKIALDSAFQMSSMADSYSGSVINSFFSVGTKLIVNATVHLLSRRTDVADVPKQIRQNLIKVIQQRQQAIGQSRLFVDGPLNPIPGVQDLDECSDETLNDCSKFSTCVNNFGSFSCNCLRGYMDKYADDPAKSGRNCAVCSPLYCNNRGDCVITAAGDKECRCHGNFIGAKCETDAEVLGVALGASLAALVIIVLTLVCLCMWSRRWKREQQKVLGMGNSYSYFSKPSSSNFNDRSHLSCSPDYHHSSTAGDHMRWPQSSNDLHDNYYAQPDSVVMKQQCYPMNRPPPLPSCPPPPTPQQHPPPSSVLSHAASSRLHPPIQPLRSLPSPLTNSRSNIMDDTDEDFEQMTANYDRFQFSKPPKSNRMVINPMNTNNVYYDVNFASNFKAGSSQHEFPMKNMRPFYS